MATISGEMVVGVFEDPQGANRAIEQLKAAGIGSEGLGVVARHSEDLDEATPEDVEMLAAEDNVVRGVSAGAFTGAGLGSLWALGIVAGVLPVIGPFVAGGILATLAAGAAGGAFAGGLLGALVGLGIPEQQARIYEEALHAGQTIVTVRSATRQTEAQEILDRNGALAIGPPAPGTPSTDAFGRPAHLDLRPERLFTHDPISAAGGFTPSGGFDQVSVPPHDSTATFHLPGEDPEQPAAPR
ncbi:MAG TPA: hypothetical protein VHZ24_10220 [Pirellulales bacterium]|jgi:hypothetical protein|nr:hypothetical protein [Pirellulales bacterium]